MTLDEDRAERVNHKAETMMSALHSVGTNAMVRMIAYEFIRLEDEIRALKDEVRLAASGLRDRA